MASNSPETANRGTAHCPLLVATTSFDLALSNHPLFPVFKQIGLLFRWRLPEYPKEG